jgi:uncharacterized membrane protein
MFVNPSQVLLLAFIIGVIAGLRSMTAPAVVAWAAHLHWLRLQSSPLSSMGSIVAVVVFTLGALVELIFDKLPSTPSRTKGAGLIARIVFGGVTGAAVALSGLQSMALGAILGAVGGIAGAFGGGQVRARLVRALRVPDFVVACIEDAVAIGGGLLVVSRF